MGSILWIDECQGAVVEVSQGVGLVGGEQWPNGGIESDGRLGNGLDGVVFVGVWCFY